MEILNPSYSSLSKAPRLFPNQQWMVGISLAGSQELISLERNEETKRFLEQIIFKLNEQVKKLERLQLRKGSKRKRKLNEWQAQMDADTTYGQIVLDATSGLEIGRTRGRTMQREAKWTYCKFDDINAKLQLNADQ
ncbi:hypothetical protein Tco_0770750 [Tanacetum coccineum]|uniref:Uncharacterized protein n=1 Tax=Tanacetum coccineum TaxID=301880 RepID=A0ABQ4ZD38_9ASTR